jgi:hypothetical protein
MKERICRWCEEKFEDMGGRIFSNHVRWCSKNPERDDTNFKNAVEKISSDKWGAHKEYTVRCLTCENNFSVCEREKLFPQREKYFCSRSCANTKKHSEDTKRKIKNALLKACGKEFKGYEKNCLFCNKSYRTLKKKQRFCSRECVNGERAKECNSTNLEKYRRKCKFGFNPYKYPNEFNIELLKNRGFYSPTNKKNNLNGVSKDHMVSVRWGFENDIDPKIMSHPANCQLMIHSENVSKNKKCDLTLEELLSKIHEWEEKYGK